MASKCIKALLSTILILLNLTLVQTCSTDGDMTIDVCVYDAGIGKCKANNKYGYIPKGFDCVLEPNTINCHLECTTACGDLMHNFAEKYPTGLPNTSVSNLKCV